MEDHMKMYLRLFNRVTTALREMEQGEYAKAEFILKLAQKEGEEMYIAAGGQREAETDE